MTAAEAAGDSTLGRDLADDPSAPPRRTFWIVLSERFLFFASFLAIAAIFWAKNHPIKFSTLAEHGEIESVQLALLVSMLPFLFVMVRYSFGVSRTVSVLMFIAMATGIVREIEVKSINGPDWWNWLTRDFSLQEILLIAGAIVLLNYAWQKRAHFWPVFWRGINPYAIPFACGVVLLFIGSYAMEKVIPRFELSLVAEEMLELAGYLLLFVGVLRTLDKILYERRSLTG